MTTPNTPDQSAEGAASETPTGSMDRFKGLAKGLFGVSRKDYEKRIESETAVKSQLARRL
jgi:hypothetical protein